MFLSQILHTHFNAPVGIIHSVYLPFQCLYIPHLVPRNNTK